jgi:hypothetical protein
MILLGIRQIIKNKSPKNNYLSKRLYKDFKIDNEHYLVKGHMNNFTITKANRFEFLVKNGIIVACRDKNKLGKFVYYGK